MKKLVFALALIPTLALAQQPQPPSAEEIQTQYLIETGQLRQALGHAQNLIAQLRKELAEFKAKSEPAK